jgi:hypothetical protein
VSGRMPGVAYTRTGLGSRLPVFRAYLVPHSIGIARGEQIKYRYEYMNKYTGEESPAERTSDRRTGHGTHSSPKMYSKKTPACSTQRKDRKHKHRT